VLDAGEVSPSVGYKNAVADVETGGDRRPA
jgi:hypothetical protein